MLPNRIQKISPAFTPGMLLSHMDTRFNVKSSGPAGAQVETAIRVVKGIGGKKTQKGVIGENGYIQLEWHVYEM